MGKDKSMVIANLMGQKRGMLALDELPPNQTLAQLLPALIQAGPAQLFNCANRTSYMVSSAASGETRTLGAQTTIAELRKAFTADVVIHLQVHARGGGIA
jgi:hypothetical protein